MPVNRVAENVLGTIGTVCWCGQLLPQIWKSYRTKSTEGLSHWLPLVWALSAVPLGVYVIVQDLNIPLILQPQLFTTFALISWVQCLYYDNGRSFRFCVAVLLGIMVTEAALETGFVYALRPAYREGKESAKRGVQFFGILSSVMISLALFPQYYEIYKHKAVVGISVTFMIVDLLGGVFSDLSLAFKEDFDVIASITYSLVVFFDAIVIIAAFILNPRARRRERERQRALAASNGVPESSPATGTDTSNAPNSYTNTIETSAANTVAAADESRPAVGETEEKDRERGLQQQFLVQHPYA
ncbi:uncharacterized protein STEHIDRAFT_131391 [Stereum hirsutum FP-91666 SS1]|uniref:uncharacterized protein n=1 Tax=Stereum hirsutum (strain FP-91666) TaxID=721885 RepID=UPI000444A42E|nr:uncharacterized protein STEHIDRAFT_131391 [Stereum hirsutum FP-91666 SS1]EIM86847.1 hypothetical protein STEHIDRAFT_131391 [Stereum hirsutum FP-91666 SS1]